MADRGAIFAQLGQNLMQAGSDWRRQRLAEQAQKALVEYRTAQLNEATRAATAGEAIQRTQVGISQQIADLRKDVADFEKTRGVAGMTGFFEGQPTMEKQQFEAEYGEGGYRGRAANLQQMIFEQQKLQADRQWDVDATARAARDALLLLDLTQKTDVTEAITTFNEFTLPDKPRYIWRTDSDKLTNRQRNRQILGDYLAQINPVVEAIKSSTYGADLAKTSRGLMVYSDLLSVHNAIGEQEGWSKDERQAKQDYLMRNYMIYFFDPNQMMQLLQQSTEEKKK